MKNQTQISLFKNQSRGGTFYYGGRYTGGGALLIEPGSRVCGFTRRNRKNDNDPLLDIVIYPPKQQSQQPTVSDDSIPDDSIPDDSIPDDSIPDDDIPW